MNFSKQITVNVPANKVWDITGHDFANIGEWATAVSHSEAIDKLPSVNNSPVGGRLCDTTLGQVSEEFTSYDEAKKTFSFKGVFDSVMFKSIVNTTKVTKIDDNTSEVKISPAIELSMLGTIMSPMIKMKLNKTIDELLNDLKYYAEHGKPSPTKIASQQK